MEVQFFGANCIRLADKKVSVIIDDNLAELGQKQVVRSEDIAIYTFGKGDASNGARFLINGPGEYEISDVSIRGIPAQAHVDEEGTNATMYSLELQNYKIGVIGHINPNLSEEQIETLGVIDLLIIPVGGNGYTVDAAGAVQLIKKIEPKIVIPTHYADSGIKYPVPQADLQVFLKEMGVDTSLEPVDSLKFKDAEMNDKTSVVVLKRTAPKSK
jgi:hypothetical protein